MKALKTAPAPEAPAEEEVVIAEPKGFYVIIGSYPTREAADRFIAENGSDFAVSYVEDLDTYRVVFSSHENLGDARASLEEAKGIVETAWIAVY